MMVARTRSRTIGAAPQMEEIRQAVLDTLGNVLAYSSEGQRGIELVALRDFTPLYVKAISNKRGEYYFPLALWRRGTFYQILSVLKRDDPSERMLWDQNGLPIDNVRLIDDMREEGGKLWRQGFLSTFVSPIIVPARPYLRKV